MKPRQDRLSPPFAMQTGWPAWAGLLRLILNLKKAVPNPLPMARVMGTASFFSC
jgi:hypothetical protein